MTEMINDMNNSTQFTPFPYQSRGGNRAIIPHIPSQFYNFSLNGFILEKNGITHNQDILPSEGCPFYARPAQRKFASIAVHVRAGEKAISLPGCLKQEGRRQSGNKIEEPENP